MDKNIIRKQVYDYLENNDPKSFGNFLRWKLDKEVIKCLEPIEGKSKAHKLYNFINDFTNTPKCLQCGKKPQRFISITEGYHDTCCKKCSLLYTYGVDNPAKLDSVKEKMKQTNQERYGGNAPICSDKIKDKMKSTMQERYGTDHALQSTEVYEKYKQTMQERHNCNTPMQSDTLKDRFKQSMIDKHGVEHPMHLAEVKEKVLESRKDHMDEIYQKISITRKRNFVDKMKTLLKRDNIDCLFDIEDYIGVRDHGNRTDYERYPFHCRTCDTKFEDIFMKNLPTCPTCNPTTFMKPQNELVEFLKGLGITNIKTNNRTVIKPYEIDIYLPDYDLAIEYNGLYWHSEVNHKHSTYHLHKTNLCNEAGIRLIHLFEDEWIYKRQIVKNRIKSILGMNNKLYARKCTIREITAPIKNKFLDKYHIQGQDKAHIKLGAFYKDRLVGIMTFAKPRIALGNKAKQGSYELSRFCTMGSFNIIGLGSKFLKHFKTNYEYSEITTYCDLRWNTGESYPLMGFEYSHSSKPNYWYCKGQKREHRFKYRKSQLSKLLSNFDESLTEMKNMKNHNFTVIWDCGNKVFKLK